MTSPWNLVEPAIDSLFENLALHIEAGEFTFKQVVRELDLMPGSDSFYQYWQHRNGDDDD